MSTTTPTEHAVAEKVKELYPDIYEKAYKVVRSELLAKHRERDRRLMANAEYREKKYARNRKYYAAHREELLHKNKEYIIRTDYVARRKLKGIKHERKEQQAENADQG